MKIFTLRRAAHAVLAVLISPVVAMAQDFPAAANQYVVEWRAEARSTGGHATGVPKAALSSIAPFSSFSLVETDDSGNLISPSRNPAIVRMAADTEFCSQLVQSGMAASCSPNFILSPRRLPNESGVGSQYWHASVNSAEAWNTTTGGGSTVVAVLDTGVDYKHPDLVNNMWRNPGEIAGNGIDDDGNGVIDDVFGFNGENISGDPMDDNEHGTHVAGIIGAEGNNGIGVAGVNWHTRIMALKFIRAEGYGYLSDALKGLDYLLAMKNRGVDVRVVNNSWGGGGFSQPLADSIERLRAAGVIFTAAAGNSGSDNDSLPEFPASYGISNIVSVAASDSRDELTSFSCFGRESVHIAAPGDMIRSTVPGNGYREMSGTSMATPMVTGALGLLFSHHPELTMEQAIDRLLRSAKPVDDMEGLTMTGRLLNVGNLINGSYPADSESGGEVCAYTATSIPFAPPSGIDESEIVMPAEGSSYVTNVQATLPFAFRFFQKNVREVTVTPNGTVFVADAPEAWEWSSHPFAPRHAIAALSTYLYDYPIDRALHGIRTKTSSDRFDVAWAFRHPWNPGAGTIKIYASLFADGTIETHVKIPTDRLARTLMYGEVVGIRGTSLANSLTMSANGFPLVIKGEMGFRYTRPSSCTAEVAPTPAATATPTPTYGESTPTPTATPIPTPDPDEPMVKGVSIQAKTKGRITARSSYALAVSGSGNGMVSLSAALNGKTCPLTKGLVFQSGLTRYRIAQPVISSRYRTLQLSVNGVKSGTVRITGKTLQAPGQTLAAACKRLQGYFNKATRIP